MEREKNAKWKKFPYLRTKWFYAYVFVQMKNV